MADADGALPPIYLDHNATTPIHDHVRGAMLTWLGDRWGNPSSGHAFGRDAARAVNRAREQVAALIGSEPDEITFTGGGTEADNMALLGSGRSRGRVVVSAVEHPAVEAPSRALEARGWVRDELPVTATGRVDLVAAAAMLADPADIVSVILAQNETGVIQPVKQVAELARRASADAIVHTDAAQAVGKVPVDVRDLGIDLLTVVSHKLYGPKGVGALFVRRGVVVRPLLLGGGQERGLRPGTEPVEIIVGLGAACELAARDLRDEASRQERLRDDLWNRLRTEIGGIRRSGDGETCLPNTVHVRFPRCDGAAVLEGAPEVAASTGSACHAADATVSGALGKMGLSVDEARGAVRLSLGRRTSVADIERAASSLIRAWRATQGS